MSKKWWFKFSLLSLVTVISVMVILPTFTRMNAAKTSYPFTKKINLGLDLQGGLYLVMGVDFNKVFRELAERQQTSLADRFKDKAYAFIESKVRTDGVPGDDPRILFKINASQKKEVKDLLSKEFPNLRLTDEKNDSLEMGISNDYRNDVREKTLNQSIEAKD